MRKHGEERVSFLWQGDTIGCMSLRRASHAVYDTKYHLVWAPKYRKSILKAELREATVEQGVAAGLFFAAIDNCTNHRRLLSASVCPPGSAPARRRSAQVRGDRAPARGRIVIRLENRVQLMAEFVSCASILVFRWSGSSQVLPSPAFPRV